MSVNFGITIFDNTQVFTLQKHQRGRKSSKSTLATNHLFVEPTIPEWFSLIPFPSDQIRVELTYLSQMISSPHAAGMLPYTKYQSAGDPTVFIRRHSIDGEDVLASFGTTIWK